MAAAMEIAASVAVASIWINRSGSRTSSCGGSHRSRCSSSRGPISPSRSRSSSRRGKSSTCSSSSSIMQSCGILAPDC